MEVTITVTTEQRDELQRALSRRESDLQVAQVMGDQEQSSEAKRLRGVVTGCYVALEAAVPAKCPHPTDLPTKDGVFWTRSDEYTLRIGSNGHACATVWPGGTWHTWDSSHVGGENSRAADVMEAAAEAVAAVNRQGFDVAPDVCIAVRSMGDRLSLDIRHDGGDPVDAMIDQRTWAAWGECAGWALTFPTLYRINAEPEHAQSVADSIEASLRDTSAPYTIESSGATQRTAAADVALTMLSFRLGPADARRLMGEHGDGAEVLPLSYGAASKIAGAVDPHTVGLALLGTMRAVLPIETAGR